MTPGAAPALCRMCNDNDFTFGDGIAFGLCLFMAPWTWKVFSRLFTSPCLFWGICYCNAVGFFSPASKAKPWLRGDDSASSLLILWSLLGVVGGFLATAFLLPLFKYSMTWAMSEMLFMLLLRGEVDPT